MTFDSKPPSGGLFRFGPAISFNIVSNTVCGSAFGVGLFWLMR